MIRQPISRSWRIVLGTACVLALLGSYSALAYRRQAARRSEAARQLDQMPERRARLEVQRAEASTIVDPVERQQKLDQLERDLGEADQQIERLQRDVHEAIDRTIPTWKSLWRDGLVRALSPQGLRKNEIWLWEDVKATATRLISGLVVAAVLSIGLGVLMGCFTSIEAFFLPTLAFLAKIPPTAMFAVFLLIGTSLQMFVTMLVFGLLPTLAQTVYQSAKNDVPDELIHKAYTLGATHLEVIGNIVYKQILPRILDAIRLQVGPAMVLLVAAEWMVADQGIGYRLRLFYQRTDMTVVFVYLILLGAAGLAVDYTLLWFRRWLCPWFGE